MNTPTILDSNGNPVQSQKHAPCPDCGRGPQERVPSGSFGQTWYVCKCGKEFKELACPSVSL